MCKTTEAFYRESSKLRQSVRGGYILFVDDEVSLLRLYSVTANKLGYEAKALTNSADAIRDIEENATDIRCVVVDVHLDADQGSTKGGFAIIECIEQLHKRLPYLVHTADPKAARSIRKKYRRAIIIEKGSSIHALLDALGIERRQQERREVTA